MAASPILRAPRNFSIRLLIRLVLLWTMAAPTAKYLFLLRVPLLTTLIVAAFPVLALDSMRTLVLGAYDLGGVLDALIFGFVLVSVIGCLSQQRSLVDRFAKVRFDADISKPVLGMDAAWPFLQGLILILNCATAYAASEPECWRKLTLGLVLGIGLAFGLGWLLKRVEQMLPPITGWVVKKIASVAKGPLPGFIGATNPLLPFSAANASFEKGHAEAVVHTLGIATVLILAPADVPPIGFVFVLIALISQVFGFLAFWADRHRIPILLCAVIWCVGMTLWRESDHYYRIWPLKATPDYPTPAEILEKAAKNNEQIVIVTAAGGGIQSAAWTARALAELPRIMNVPDINNRIRLISGVSGGSVGALHFAHAFSFPATDAGRFERAAKAAAASSLREATSGLARWDFLRALAPWSFLRGDGLFRDRGQSLQNAWVQNSDQLESLQTNGPSLGDATLSQWAQDARELKRPAVLFNSTVVETGERMALCTAPRAGDFDTRRKGNFEFAQRFKADIAMVTAARLSATFPVVSPAAHPAVAESAHSGAKVVPTQKHWEVFPHGGSLLHSVDGGYFENTGMVGALEWLDDGLLTLDKKGKEALPKSILILELSAFLDPSTDGAVDKDAKPGGLVSDLISPLIAIANVRNSGQQSFASQSLDLFKRYWKEKGVTIDHIPIAPDRETVQLAKKEADTPWFIEPNWDYAPLSWHLRKREIDAISTMTKERIRLAFASPPKPDTLALLSSNYQKAVLARGPVAEHMQWGAPIEPQLPVIAQGSATPPVPTPNSAPTSPPQPASYLEVLKRHFPEAKLAPTQDSPLPP